MKLAYLSSFFILIGFLFIFFLGQVDKGALSIAVAAYLEATHFGKSTSVSKQNSCAEEKQP